ncbi:MAG: argininosuccinate synthase [Ignavibacteria bacterium CG_4_8_14_3_um_filter_37_9]|nr:argininosuccinate synthase [Ignavibacteria bacterium]OIO14564.1 MAG: argininosuccinate synthase [Ignavibacteria bacterium CG1_02_37_35]PIS44886.1 MAG: argininosuccinate synthase [Ignavibacteria bacterium CG08_land_8_20_14_0_20_37_9]PIW98520.1 MAG: argininosuccinate synthase [Ignavibacteria bacterium CG_4_8_14_3_um_filter_37_9]PIX93865.1 MAG: argininosuccinate synthase [Ignavibacteria bacterium CG_4_10_14_3_um_filter_37_18]
MSYKKIVVAYSGGLDTSVMVHWLKNKYDAELITVTGNLGQKDELENLEEKAKLTGASKSYILDLQKEFITEYVWKALKAGALYEGQYPMATAIGRPLLVKLMVDIALAEGADTIAHGCTGKGNDQVRFEVGIQTLAPHLKILAPLRIWEFKSREEEIDYALEHKIPIKIKKASPYSIDENLWGIAVECGVLEDPTVQPPADAYQITSSPKDAPDKAESISIEFVKGIPVSLNRKPLPAVDLVKELNVIGGKHGIGRMDLIENRVVGIKSREVYEAPAAVILHTAHKELEKLILDKETFRFKQGVSDKVANLIYDGLWFSPLFDSLMAFVDSTQENISGSVTLEFYKGNITVLSRSSLFSLYNKDLATYTIEDKFDHKAAEGFLALYGLPYKTLSLVKAANTPSETKAHEVAH